MCIRDRYEEEVWDGAVNMGDRMGDSDYMCSSGSDNEEENAEVAVCVEKFKAAQEWPSDVGLPQECGPIGASNVEQRCCGELGGGAQMTSDLETHPNSKKWGSGGSFHGFLETLYTWSL
eukprot:TRINITY_DN2618_c0_g1_i4.p1 TRINITY_DN2618_c0_g1~~TRINITY_DN2618_c0_g1_i4.p1  ORF type:complete len:119 (-),score=24.41 TRINITY_DN2618_c0_g1_i4:263-619(-)